MNLIVINIGSTHFKSEIFECTFPLKVNLVLVLVPNNCWEVVFLKVILVNSEGLEIPSDATGVDTITERYIKMLKFLRWILMMALLILVESEDVFIGAVFFNVSFVNIKGWFSLDI